jgi:hypothetical protein
MDNNDIRKIAADFWRTAGGSEGFPRNIEASILWALPLAVVKLPRLRIASVRAWLSEYGLPAIVPAGERELRACVVASRGHGVIFIDGSDPADEQRMSLAHELAHFLLDYVFPRDRAIHTFGLTILSVLDGARAPSPAERLSAVLRGVTLGVYSRLWLRGPLGLARDTRAVAQEDLADMLALELLAPRREIFTRARRFIDQSQVDPISMLLRTEFGLPESSANAYARVLWVSAKPAPSMRDWLGMK